MAEAIVAGKYDFVNEYITAENFNLGGEIVVDAEQVLYHPNRAIGSDDAVKELDQMELRPAILQELCAFGEKYPDIQRKFPVVALGSVCVDLHGHRDVAYLDYWFAGRELRLFCWVDEWSLDYRFLAARKPACPAGR